MYIWLEYIDTLILRVETKHLDRVMYDHHPSPITMTLQYSEPEEEQTTLPLTFFSLVESLIISMTFKCDSAVMLLTVWWVSSVGAFRPTPIGRGIYQVTKTLLSSTPQEQSLLDAGYALASEDTYRIAPVSQVYVAELEKLSGGQYPTNFENRIKFDRANLRKRQHVSNRQDNGEDDSLTLDQRTRTSSREVNMEYNNLVGDDDLVLVDIARKSITSDDVLSQRGISRAFHRAGPRQKLHFDPSKVNAAIVTCGGLCPGLNNVIRELVHSLFFLYGANKVYGITGGFHGFYKPEFQPILLTNELVENIHHDGGTILRSSRGGFDIDKIMQFLQENDISQLYIIGGDGTHRGAYAIHQACIEQVSIHLQYEIVCMRSASLGAGLFLLCCYNLLVQGLNIAVAGIPKTIDNDVDFIDRSFGFTTAVEAAQMAIRTAKTEAMCNVPNGIGIIKLMGRSAGFLSAYAALGSGDVDLVLIPEVPIVLDGPDGILLYLRQRVKEHQFAVVVVAEGAGEEILGVSTKVDAGGNRKLPKIGKFIRSSITEYFKSFGEDATIK